MNIIKLNLTMQRYQQLIVHRLWFIVINEFK